MLGVMLNIKVGEVGLEPTHLAIQGSEPCASTCSATRPIVRSGNNAGYKDTNLLYLPIVPGEDWLS